VRVQTQGALFDDNDAEAELPSIMRVMDLQQEQLARSLGDGHRVIHGVAGSGKTMILGYRAEYLAKASTHASKPILILCFNEPLGVKLHSVMQAKGLGGRVHVRHFHKWCRDQLVAFGQTLPDQSGSTRYVEELVQRVITAVDRKQIPSGQYQAVMLDEGHDFAPEWLKLVTQMVDPATNSPMARSVVRSLDPAVVAGTQSLLAKAEFANPTGVLRNGLRTRTRLILDERSQLSVPFAAVTQISGQRFVYGVGSLADLERRPGQAMLESLRKLPPGTTFALQTPVELGPLQNNRYPVLRGLEPGQRVITSNLINLRHGLPVKVN
jgi:hypothetical protein